MSYSIKNITVDLVLKSFADDFDENERNQILNVLREDNIEDDSLLGLKLLLEDNNWEYESILDSINGLELKIDRLANKENKSKYAYYKYAAIFAPILFISSYYFFQNNSSIDNYYIAETGLPNLMGSDDMGDLSELMILLKRDEKEKAFTLSKRLFENQQNNDTIIYFKAVLAYETNRFQESRADFETIVNSCKNSYFNFDASFRLGFALHKSGFIQESKKQFELISQQFENPFAEDSKQILKDIF